MDIKLIALFLFCNIPAYAQQSAKDCSALHNRFVVGARELLTKFPDIKGSPNNYVAQLATVSKSACSLTVAATTTREIVTHLNASSGKIGIILPLTGPLATYGQSIIEGIKAQFNVQNTNFSAVVVLKDNRSDTSNDERLYAELVLVDQVQAVIGGFQSAAANTLSTWSEKLAVPTMLLSPPPKQQPQKKKKYSFHIFPRITSLIDTLAAFSKQKNYSRIAMLYPRNQSGQMIADLSRPLFKNHGLTITEEAFYSPSDYASMEASARKIFHSEDPQRAEEYRDLVAHQKIVTGKNGLPFNAKMVVLPPQINFDVVLIPDNFKQVRHLIQIFKYLGVKQIPLMGMLEWRSEGLLNPFDRFLNGSYFADFIGNYQDLPLALKPPMSSNYMADIDTLESLDFRIVGWRAADALLINKAAIKKRHSLANALANWVEAPKAYFGAGKAFDNNHNSRWPSYVFSIFNQKLQLEVKPILSQNSTKP